MASSRISKTCMDGAVSAEAALSGAPVVGGRLGQTTRPRLSEHACEVLAGTAGGWAQVLVGHPFDTIKVRLQTHGSYTGPLDCLARTVKMEGAQGLLRGMSSPLVGIGICNATLFSANEHFRRLFQKGDPTHELSKGELAMAGGMSGVVISMVITPLELVKIRMQVQTGRGSGPGYASSLDCTLRTLKERGIPGLYRGLGITLMREIPSFAAYFAGYEMLKELLVMRYAEGDRQPRTVDLLVAGGIAGQLGWVSCYPQDVIKSRVQAESRHGLVAVARSMWRGPGGGLLGRVWWRGFGTTMLRAFPANAATFVVYERCMEWMREDRDLNRL